MPLNLGSKISRLLEAEACLRRSGYTHGEIDGQTVSISDRVNELIGDLVAAERVKGQHSANKPDPRPFNKGAR